MAWDKQPLISVGIARGEIPLSPRPNSAAAIEYHRSRGMSMARLISIYGKDAVLQVIGQGATEVRA